MKKWDWVRSVPVVRSNDIARRLKTNEYARLSAHRLMKSGILKRVTHGVYTASEDAFAIASNIHYPSYISFLSASYRHGLTESIPSLISVAVTERHKCIDFSGYSIEFVPIKCVWGYHKEGDGQHICFIADIEKLIIDAFLRPEHMGNFAEIENIFMNAARIDNRMLTDYLGRIGSGRLWGQVGWMLEKHRGIDISGAAPRGRNYYQLNPFSRGRKIDRKWRLWV